MPKRDDTQASRGLQMVVLFFVFLTIATVASILFNNLLPIGIYIGVVVGWFVAEAIKKRGK